MEPATGFKSDMNNQRIPLPLRYVKSARVGRLVSPLPTFWTWGRKFRGWRISILPAAYRAKALTWKNLPCDLRAALIAVDSFRILEADQQEGR